MAPASKLIPPHPETVAVIRAVTPNIVTISAPFARMGLIKVGSRATLVRLSNGSLAVFSPTALTPEVRSTVDNLGGDLKYIAAPDIEHHIFVSEWHKAFPNASVIAVEGLPEKREKNPDTKGTIFSHIFKQVGKDTMTIDPDFDRDFDYEYVHGHQNKELVFNYRPDRTLIQADLIWNLPATEQYSKSGESAASGIFTKLLSGVFSLKSSPIAQQRLLWYGLSRGDRPGFNDSMRRIDKWDFDRIIPCHGDVIETGAKSKWSALMQWHLAAAK